MRKGPSFKRRAVFLWGWDYFQGGRGCFLKGEGPFFKGEGQFSIEERTVFKAAVTYLLKHN